MVPSCLLAYVGCTPTQMGIVLSGMGFGGFLGQWWVPALSDWFGRRTMAIVGFVGAAVFVWVFAQIGANPTLLFLGLFMTSFFCLGNIALITGPIATESAPVGFVSSAIGIVVGTGEIFGGGVAPSLAGYIAENYGIQNILYLALAGVSLGVVVSLFLKETAPSKS